MFVFVVLADCDLGVVGRGQNEFWSISPENSVLYYFVDNYTASVMEVAYRLLIVRFFLLYWRTECSFRNNRNG